MKECDLVMRGGTTSGVVYPKAIVGLSKAYRFRQIGGASAGAIAAAFCAAAEYGRQDEGFNKLDKIPHEFESGLAKYFQPYPAYQKLFAAVLKLMEQKKSPGLWWVVRNGFRIKRAVEHLPSTHFGVCPGTITNKRTENGLVDWLNRRLEFVAGRMTDLDGQLPSKPLTFGDLKAKNIELRLISTNLSQRRPNNLPIGPGFKFRRSDLGWLLPDNVARWVEDNAGSSEEYLDVPCDADMPVILAVRMSLAFPVLFSAVPLYTKDFSLRNSIPGCVAASEELRINLFSDGGLSSNFPIHYFDAPIPTRPTFGINLSDYHPCRHGDDDVNGWNRIYLPAAAGGSLTYGINPIKGVLGFLGALLITAKDWQDSVQMRMPGYRERIVHVALKEDEGGTNLAMDEETIRGLIQLGDRSAERILTGHKHDLADQPPFSLQVHRWRRLLAVTEALDSLIDSAVAAFLTPHPSGDASIGPVPAFLDDLIVRMSTDPKLFDDLGYRPTSTQDLKNLKARWEALAVLRDTWRNQPFSPQWNLPSPSADARFRSKEF